MDFSKFYYPFAGSLWLAKILGQNINDGETQHDKEQLEIYCNQLIERFLIIIFYKL